MGNDKTTTITLTIATALINQTNIKSNAEFSDNWGTKETGNDSTSYTSHVFKDKDIVWKAAINSGAGKSVEGDAASIIGILKKPGNSGGDDILKEDCYYATSGQVTAKVKKGAADNSEESYLLVFSVTTNNVVSYYLIDPKIKVNPS